MYVSLCLTRMHFVSIWSACKGTAILLNVCFPSLRWQGMHKLCSIWSVCKHTPILECMLPCVWQGMHFVSIWPIGKHTPIKVMYDSLCVDRKCVCSVPPFEKVCFPVFDRELTLHVVT